MVYLNLLAIGSAGHGKTRLVYSSAFVEGMYPVLGINMGGNPVSIREYPQDKIKIFNINAESDFTDIGEWIFNGQKLTAPFATKNKITARFNTLVIDGVTEYQRRLSSTSTGLDKAKFGEMKREMPKIQDYGYLANATLEFGFQAFSLSANLNMHVLCTCLEETTENGGSKLALIGAAADKFAGYPEIVVRMRNASAYNAKQLEEIKKLAIEQGEIFNEDIITARLKTTEGISYPKFQLLPPSKIPSIMINPTMTKFFNLVNK